MVYPGKSRKMYARPRTPWQAEMIAGEVEVVKAYGLRNKRDLFKAQAILRKYRKVSRKMLAAVSVGQAPPQAEAILTRLKKLGMLKEEGDLDAILSMKVADVLERRLQTQVYRQGLANSLKQARQFIVHGHIQISGRRIVDPSYLVNRDEENTIAYLKTFNRASSRGWASHSTSNGKEPLPGDAVEDPK